MREGASRQAAPSLSGGRPPAGLAAAVRQDDVELQDLVAVGLVQRHRDVLKVNGLVARQNGQQLLLQLWQVVRAPPGAGPLPRNDHLEAILRHGGGGLRSSTKVIEKRHV